MFLGEAWLVVDNRAVVLHATGSGGLFRTQCADLFVLRWVGISCGQERRQAAGASGSVAHLLKPFVWHRF